MPVTSSSTIARSAGARQLTLALRGAWPFVPFAELDAPVAPAVRVGPADEPPPTDTRDAGQLALELVRELP
jgi:hypothetical protein